MYVCKEAGLLSEEKISANGLFFDQDHRIDRYTITSIVLMQPSRNRTPPSHSTHSLRIYSLLGSVHNFPDLSSVGSTYIYIPIFSRLSRKIQRYRHHFFFHGILAALRLWTHTCWKWKRESELVRWSDSDVRIAEAIALVIL